ncbi:MAG: hypothetical protein H6R01_1481 [Burkholderiaceae bacterium]|nr:hypothetical protein [Burkholderiaceae bacterium]
MQHDNPAFPSASLGLAARTNEGGTQETAQTGHSVSSKESCAPLGGTRLGGADQGGAAALNRLDKRTYFDQLTQGQCRVYIRDYGERLAEIGWSFTSAKKPDKAGKGESKNKLANQDRAARRSRTRMRQLILSAHLDHLLTLTYRENQTNYAQATDDLARFVRKVRRAISGWHYVAVAERQERGAWHWHIAVKGHQDVHLLRTCWLAVVGDGNIDVQAPKQGKQKQRLGVVRYLSKYLSKTFAEDDRIFNGHRFRASHGIYVPCISIPVPKEERGRLMEYAISQLLNHAGKVGHIWQDDQMIAGWACSWS